MRRWLGVALALWAAPVAAQEGVYQSHQIEVGSQLVLAPNGRFVWFFAYGALDLTAEGRWTRAADGTVSLTSEPAVTAPGFELVSRSRDEQPGVAIRLACDTGDMRMFLSVITEHADGQRIAHRFHELEYRTGEGDPASPVTGVMLGSESFGFLSERFAVNPAEANVLAFRFIPNDLGRIHFDDVRLAIADGAFTLTLGWLGLPVRYQREGSAAGAELPELPPLPRREGDADAAPAPLAVTIGEPFGQLRARAGATLREGESEWVLVARGPVDLTLGHGAHSIELGRVEGGRTPLRAIAIAEEADDSRPGVVGAVRFGHQDGPVTLAEALRRAQALKAWLEQAGFAPAEISVTDPPPFRVMGEPDIASDWESAARVMADPERAFGEMDLYVLRTPTHRAQVRLVNSRRLEREACAHAEWPHADGREWRLLVEIERN